jgi:hypothetical protein
MTQGGAARGLLLQEALRAEQTVRRVESELLLKDNIEAVFRLLLSPDYGVHSQSLRLLAMLVFKPNFARLLSSKRVVEAIVRIAFSSLRVIDKHDALAKPGSRNAFLGLAGDLETIKRQEAKKEMTREQRHNVTVLLAAGVTTCFHAACVLRGLAQLPSNFSLLVSAGAVPLLYTFCGVQMSVFLKRRMYVERIGLLKELAVSALQDLMKADQGVSACLRLRYPPRRVHFLDIFEDKEAEPALLFQALRHLLMSRDLQQQRTVMVAIAKTCELQNDGGFAALFVRFGGLPLVLKCVQDAFSASICTAEAAALKEEPPFTAAQLKNITDVIVYGIRVITRLSDNPALRPQVAAEATSVLVQIASAMLRPPENATLRFASQTVSVAASDQGYCAAIGAVQGLAAYAPGAAVPSKALAGKSDHEVPSQKDGPQSIPGASPPPQLQPQAHPSKPQLPVPPVQPSVEIAADAHNEEQADNDNAELERSLDEGTRRVAGFQSHRIFLLILEVFAKLASQLPGFNIEATGVLRIARQMLRCRDPIGQSLAVVAMTPPSPSGPSFLFEAEPTAMALLYELHSCEREPWKRGVCEALVAVALVVLLRLRPNHGFLVARHYVRFVRPKLDAAELDELEDDERAEHERRVEEMRQIEASTPPWNAMNILFALAAPQQPQTVRRTALMCLQRMSSIVREHRGRPLHAALAAVAPSANPSAKPRHSEARSTLEALPNPAHPVKAHMPVGERYFVFDCGENKSSVLEHAHVQLLVGIIDLAKADTQWSKQETGATSLAPRDTALSPPTAATASAGVTSGSSAVDTMAAIANSYAHESLADLREDGLLSLATLCNLCSDADNHDVIKHAKAIPLLLNVLTIMMDKYGADIPNGEGWGPKMHSFGVMAISNLLTNPRNHVEIQVAGRLGFVSSIVDFIQTTTRINQRVACLALANMCSTYEREHYSRFNPFDLIALGNTTRLVDVRSARYLALALCKLTSHSAFVFERHVTLNMDSDWAAGKNRGKALRTRKVTDALPEGRGSVSATHASGLTINVVPDDSSATGMASDFDQACPVLVSGLLRLAQSSDRETHEYAFVALVNLVLKVQRLTSLFADMTLVDVFLRILKSSDPATQLLALACLRRLGELEANRVFMANASELSRLVSLSFNESMLIRREVAENLNLLMRPPVVSSIKFGSIMLSALAQLALAPEASVNGPGLTAFFGYLKEDSAIEAMLQMARDEKDGKSASHFTSCLKVLLLMVSSGADSTALRVHCDQALGLLQRLTECVELTHFLVEKSALQTMTYHLLHGDLPIGITVLRCVRNISVNPQTHPLFLEQNGVDCMLFCLTSPKATREEQQVAAESLAHVIPYCTSRITTNKSAMAETLVKLTDVRDDLKLLNLIAVCLVRLAVEHTTRTLLMQEKVVDKCEGMLDAVSQQMPLVRDTVEPAVDVELATVALLTRMASDDELGEQVCIQLARKERLSALLERCNMLQASLVQFLHDEKRRREQHRRQQERQRQLAIAQAKAAGNVQELSEHERALMHERLHHEKNDLEEKIALSWESYGHAALLGRYCRLLGAMSLIDPLRLRLASLGVVKFLVGLKALFIPEVRRIAIASLFAILENEPALKLCDKALPYLRAAVAYVHRHERDSELESHAEVILERMIASEKHEQQLAALPGFGAHLKVVSAVAAAAAAAEVMAKSGMLSAAEDSQTHDESEAHGSEGKHGDPRRQSSKRALLRTGSRREARRHTAARTRGESSSSLQEAPIDEEDEAFEGRDSGLQRAHHSRRTNESVTASDSMHDYEALIRSFAERADKRRSGCARDEVKDGLGRSPKRVSWGPGRAGLVGRGASGTAGDEDAAAGLHDVNAQAAAEFKADLHVSRIRQVRPPSKLLAGLLGE